MAERRNRSGWTPAEPELLERVPAGAGEYEVGDAAGRVLRQGVARGAGGLRAAIARHFDPRAIEFIPAGTCFRHWPFAEDGEPERRSGGDG